MGVPGSAVELRNAPILIAFSEPMWPSDLLDPAKVTVTTNTGSLPTIDRSIEDLPVLFLTPRKAWPASATITVTVLTTVRDAKGNALAANRVFTLNTPCRRHERRPSGRAVLHAVGDRREQHGL
jgi:hypothetical protein